MAEHPIEGLMHTAFNQIKAMVDVNAIVGDPVQTPDGSVIIPISRVALGFAAGGSDYRVEKQRTQEKNETCIPTVATNGKPFGGGSGGGIHITPIAFLVVNKQGSQVVSLDNHTHVVEKLIDIAPHIVEKFSSLFRHKDHTCE